MKRRWTLLAVGLAATGVACGTSAPSKFYTLRSTAGPDNGPPVHSSVMVGPVTVPASVDRLELVVQVAPNRVEIDEFNRWAAPLDTSIARTIAGDLTTLLETPDVAAWPMANFNPAYRVTIDVQQFQSVPKQEVLIDAVWTVRKAAGGDTRAGRTIARETVRGTDYDAIAAAYSRALSQVSADIAAAIRTEAEPKPSPTPQGARKRR